MSQRNLWSAVALAAALAGAVPALSAEANPVSAKSDEVKVKLYGQVDRAVLFVDDGDKTKSYFVDNDASSTRIGITAASKPAGNLAIGSKIEVQIESNTSSSVNRNEEDTGNVGFTQRHLDLYVEYGSLGKLSLGHGDTASNGSAEVDLSGTSLVGYSDIPTFAGGQYFWDDGSGSLSDLRIKDVFNNFDGNSRRDRVRYDTPKVFGFTLSASAAESDRADVALRYALALPVLKAEVAVARAYEGSSSRSTVDAGSASVRFGFGLSLTAAVGRRELHGSDREDPGYYYGKLGYQRKFFPIGSTALSVDYGAFADVKADGDDATVFGVQFVQKLEDYGTELFAGYRRHDLDREGVDFAAIDGVMVGGRVKF